MERDLLSIAVDDLTKNWKHFDMKENPLTEYDYHIILNLTNLQFSPEKEKNPEAIRDFFMNSYLGFIAN